MSTTPSLPYKLRPNKAVDRELFLALLGRLAATLKIESYRYIGLGGAFLEDFRLVHARLGLHDMVCVESEESIHLRQKFNRPVDCIECIHNSLEEYIDSTDFEKPVIIWFDYTDPSKMTDQIERFSRTISEVPINSILRITLNSNPSTLGEPKPDEIAARVGGLMGDSGQRRTLQEWRLERFRERLGYLFPSDLKADGMTFKSFGKSVLTVLYLAVEGEALKVSDRKVVWALATHYADGQPMVTATLIVTDTNDKQLEVLTQEWPFSSTPEDPMKLDMPALSTIERLTMESCNDPREKMGYDLPKSELGENPYEMFRRFYRVYPHFARIDL
ncbi:MAG: O-methyltransferase [bacterium]